MATESMSIASRPQFSVVRTLLAAAGLPTADLSERHCEHFFFCGDGAAPAGLVGLELYGPVALLRSLVVDPARRGQGLGGALVDHAEAQARAHGVERLYLLTTTAAPFFARRGYESAARDTAPDAIRATSEFSGLCPASSSFMVKQLRGEQ